MSELPGNELAAPRLRADAKRSISAILEAAIEVLGERPAASMEEIAAAAGVSRQTIYAHFRSREALLRALLEQFTDKTMAVLDAARLEEGSPAAALGRFLNTSWEIFGRHPFLLHVTFPPVAPEEDRERHAPMLQRLERLIKRGQASGEFDSSVPVSWLLTATVTIGHAAGEEVRAGRMSQQQAATVVHQAVLRVFGVKDSLARQ